MGGNKKDKSEIFVLSLVQPRSREVAPSEREDAVSARAGAPAREDGVADLAVPESGRARRGVGLGASESDEEAREGLVLQKRRDRQAARRGRARLGRRLVAAAGHAPIYAVSPRACAKRGSVGEGREKRIVCETKNERRPFVETRPLPR